jgi:hypothetical protein
VTGRLLSAEEEDEHWAVGDASGSQRKTTTYTLDCQRKTGPVF